MKKILLFAAMGMLSSVVFAQKYDETKNMMMLPGGFAKAKETFDKNSTNEKFYTKPEGYIQKAAIFGNMALDSAKAADAAKNREEGYNAFMKYKEMDPSLKLVQDPVYQNAPYWLYASYFNGGVPALNTQDEAIISSGYQNLKKAVELSDFLIANNIQLKGPIDTSLVFYTGYLAERTNDTEGMVKYYGKLADARINPEKDYERVYQSLVRYYAMKQDQANFDKYKALGKELYPASDFFNYNMLDFAVGASGGFTEKVANLEKMTTANPEDYKAQLALGEAIFDTLNSRKEGAVLPTNYDELEGKMLGALNKAATLKPDELQPLLLLGDHYTTKSEKIGDEMRPVETDLIKKGSKATAADKQKLADLKTKYDAAYDKAKENFEKAANMFAKKGELDHVQKRQYRIIVGNLAQYFSYKRESAKGAELNKILAEETKYNNLYDQLRK